MKIDPTVTVLLPAPVRSVAELKRSVAVKCCIRCNQSLFQGCCRNNELVGGTWRILTGNGPVSHGVRGIIRQIIPIFRRNSYVEETWIKGRRTCERKDSAVTGIYGNNRPCSAFNGLPCSLLQIGINCKNNIISGDRFNLADYFDLFAQYIHLDLFCAALSLKVLI